MESSSGISSYNPISDLERQYAAPVGQRVHIFVKLNPSCCLIGGVETLLKQKEPLQVASASGSTAVTSASNAGEDPFSFLTDAPSNNDGSDVAGVPSSPLPPSKDKAGAKVGKFFTKLAKTTQSQLEKGITNLAIKADQGKNPDILQLGLYDASGTQLLSLTETQAFPMTDYERMKGVTFTIPLTVPPDTDINNTVLTLKLWIKSGSPLLKLKFYLLGQTHLSLANIRQGQNSQSRIMIPQSLPLQSNSVVDGQLHLLVCSDCKFPQPYARGWSLTDPDMNGYMSLFHLPLDQSYAFFKGNDWWVATERATESTVVLPLTASWANLLHRASQISMAHATTTKDALLANRHDSPLPHKATVQTNVGFLHLADAKTTAAAQLSLHWQRPDSIFEIELLANTRVPVHTVQVPFATSASTTFYPKVATPESFLPALRQQSSTPAYLLGNLRILITIASGKSISVADPFGSPAPGSQMATLAEDEMWHAIVPLESYISQGQEPRQIPVYHSVTGVAMGHVVLQLSVTMPIQKEVPVIAPSAGGLVSLVGLDTLMEGMGSLPCLDHDAPTTPPADPRRHQQLYTMGNFITHQYLQNHIETDRSKDCNLLNARATLYSSALLSKTEMEPSHKDRSPRAFRPSSSRLTEDLSGIPFNVHTVTLALEQSTPTGAAVAAGGFFQNITCGAPADHARGFSSLFSPGGPSGGLRRLESRRSEWQAKVVEAQTALIGAVATFFVSARQANQTVYHIPARNQHMANLRWKVFEYTQQLHQITWECTMRRANVFSQALGIALTSYLTSISSNTQWPELWVQHGYLVTYEGLLSAAGKELGMIEDASVGIGMLRAVSVQLVSAEAAPPPDKVDIPSSPLLKWIQVTASGVGSATQYVVRIAMDPQYYATALPEPLRNNAYVRFYPLLYQVGVDIRQAAAHTHMNVKQQLNSSVNTTVATGGCGGATLDGTKSDDEDDDMGAVADDDVLVSLNYEALRKMNVYAHAISPIAPSGGDTQQQYQQQQQVHPILTSLHNHILGSSGKMNHGILDEAASVAQKLGGGGVVFCKSGKDRTAMHVTYKQAQYIHRYLHGTSAPVTQQQLVYEDATKMRVYGTRLPICEKNVGQAKYAFNTLQVRFMPEMLKPPVSTLAGFLKGGAVFKSGGGIES